MTAAYDNANIFAKILRGELPCEKVYDDEHVLAFMDIMPRADGHVLVIPKTPARNILDIDAAHLSQMMPSLQTVVFHLHFHILPRWEGVKLRPHTGDMEKPERLKDHAAKIRAAF